MTYYTFPVTYTESGRTGTSTQTLAVHDQKISELLANGANGSVSFPDTTGRVWTPFGNVQNSTAQFAEGTASMLFDGTGDYLTTPDTVDMRNSGDWRIEAAIRVSSLTAARTIFSRRPVSGTAGESLWQVNTAGKLSLLIWSNDGSTIVANPVGATVLAINTWYDVAIERENASGRYRILVNNAEDASAVQSGTQMVASITSCIGRDMSSSGAGVRDFAGYIDRFRFLRP